MHADKFGLVGVVFRLRCVSICLDEEEKEEATKISETFINMMWTKMRKHGNMGNVHVDPFQTK